MDLDDAEIAGALAIDRLALSPRELATMTSHDALATAVGLAPDALASNLLTGRVVSAALTS